MIIIDIYKNILTISINEAYIDQFYRLFELKKSSFISDNGMKLLFVYCEKSKVIIEENLISIFISLAKFDIMMGLFKQYLNSDRKFPLDISLEQLDFSIKSNEIADVVFECGQFNDD